MVDIATAQHHGVCPECEGYGGRTTGDDGCPNELCQGSCPSCWCDGCHDGQLTPDQLTADLAKIHPEEWGGSWEAYAAIHSAGPAAPSIHPDQEALDV